MEILLLIIALPVFFGSLIMVAWPVVEEIILLIKRIKQ